MKHFARKCIKDSDIDLKRVEKRLSEIAEAISVNNKNNLTDINIICEEIFGNILNKLYDIKLVSMSTEVSGNFMAVDLVDYQNKIAYQVTSQNSRRKIDNTIKKFKKSSLYRDIDELHFLILNTKDCEYKAKPVLLKDGNTFSYTKNIMNFNKLMNEIKKKNDIKNNFIIEVYDCISMVYDSGRLRNFNIVKETKELMEDNTICNPGEEQWWIKGYGDVGITAIIPLSYNNELSCILQIRQHNLSGACITIHQDELIADYFVDETDFEVKHNIVRREDEDDTWMDIGNVRIKLNAHTAYHIYQLFNELKVEYCAAIRDIEEVLGVDHLHKEGNKYMLMIIDIIQWKEIFFFAKNHDCFENNEEIEWSIFNNSISRENYLVLSPNIYGTVRGDILAKLSVSANKLKNNKLNLYWEPGFKEAKKDMECFDNNIKWKADYTAEWINNKLLDKAHKYWNKYHGKWSF